MKRNKITYFQKIWIQIVLLPILRKNKITAECRISCRDFENELLGVPAHIIIDEQEELKNNRLKERIKQSISKI